MNKEAAVMAKALWKTMREREMTLEDALDVCTAVLGGVAHHAPASTEELLCRLQDKLDKPTP